VAIKLFYEKVYIYPHFPESPGLLKLSFQQVIGFKKMLVQFETVSESRKDHINGFQNSAGADNVLHISSYSLHRLSETR
jgi:hypothetical protein